MLDQIPGSVLIGQAAFDRTFLRPQNQYVLVNGSTKAQLAAALKPYPETKVFTGTSSSATAPHSSESC